MSDTLKELEALERRVSQAEAALQQARGKEEALLERLRDEHGCGSPEEARKRLEDLERRVGELEAELREGLVRVRAKWGLQ